MSVAMRCMNPAIFGDGYDGFIYFIQLGDIGPIKIGFAKDYQKRFKAIQWANPYKLNLLYATPACLKDEQSIHCELRKYHPELCLTGEWYHPGKLIFDTIADFKRWDKKSKTDSDKEVPNG